MDKETKFQACLHSLLSPEAISRLEEGRMGAPEVFYARLWAPDNTREGLRKALGLECDAFWRLCLSARRELDADHAEKLRESVNMDDFPLGAWPESENDEAE